MSDKEKNDDSSRSSWLVEETRDPGASRHGNFINYYKFHPAEDRVRQLPRGVWLRPTLLHQDRKYICLDVGCNAGDLTVSLGKFLRREIADDKVTIHLLGVDVDPTLIERAREKMDSSCDPVTFECLDFMEKKNRNAVLKNYLDEHSRDRFDVVFCFSITMWIHLNNGDEGLVDYLEAVSSLAQRILVVEPQSWKCYRNASRRLRRAGIDDFKLLNSLKLTGDIANHIDRIITNCSFRRLIRTEPNQWGRTLLIYERNS